MPIDFRKKYYLIIDTETAPCSASNEVNPYNMFVYDIGYAVIDRKGTVYHTESMVISDIFCSEHDLMQSAYYAEKIPQYIKDIQAGNRQIVSFYTARQKLLAIMEQYHIDTVIAHNMRFDYGTLNNTQRWLTKSKYRYFFPYGTKIWDTMRMAQDTICKQKNYRKFCEQNNLLTKTNQVRKTAEALYRYISGKWDFMEKHTALEDVMIEKEIFSKCMAQHKKMKKECFGK